MVDIRQYFFEININFCPNKQVLKERIKNHSMKAQPKDIENVAANLSDSLVVTRASPAGLNQDGGSCKREYENKVHYTYAFEKMGIIMTYAFFNVGKLDLMHHLL